MHCKSLLIRKCLIINLEEGGSRVTQGDGLLYMRLAYINHIASVRVTSFFIDIDAFLPLPCFMF
jgi:hypothetical protein